ncbi:MAG: hypothetical protein ACREAA_02220 [Candidatus Polarisedimenticolia bacterium]
MNTNPIVRTLAILLVLAVAGVFSGAVHADKLVVFKNGKALKAKSVVEDGQWLKCEFEDNNFISVKASLVQGIEEAAIGASDADLRFNKVAAGSGYTPPPAPRADDGGGSAAQAAAQQQLQQQEENDAAAAALEEQQAIQAQGGVFMGNKNGRRGLNPGNQQQMQQQQQQNGGIQGLTPLNQAQTPFQNRGLSPRQANQRRGSRFGAQPQGNNQQEGNEQN